MDSISKAQRIGLSAGTRGQGATERGSEPAKCTASVASVASVAATVIAVSIRRRLVPPPLAVGAVRWMLLASVRRRLLVAAVATFVLVATTGAA